MEFTGERYVPGATPSSQLYTEHMSRYTYASAIAEGKRVLDVGCGCGYGTYYLALKGAASVLGIDRAHEAIEFARTHYRHTSLKFAVMDAYNLALEGTFDLVTCFEVFEHVEKPRRLLEEICRVVRDDGLALISTPNRLTYRAGGPSGKNPFHFREYDEGEFRDVLSEFFGSVTLLGQFWTEGIVIGRGDLMSEVQRAAVLPEEDGTIDTSPLNEPAYFLAVCCKSGRAGEHLEQLIPVTLDFKQRRWREIKQAASKLERELDERGKWAKRLDEEIAARDATIRRLQDELKDLREQFDERGKWALGLDKQVRELQAYIEHLRREGVIRPA